MIDGVLMLMERIIVITNPMPIHNNSPAVSLGKLVQLIRGAGYSPEIVGARLPEEGISGVCGDVFVKSFRYGGRGVMKLLSFGALQLKMFFYCLTRLRQGDAVYFWIADKMIGAFLAARLRRAEINYFLYGKVFRDGEGGISEKLVRYMMNRASYVCAESPAVLHQWNVPDSLRRDFINLFVPDASASVIPYENREHTVAMYCRLSIGKHVDDAVRAFCKVHETMPEYKLKIVGGGVLEADIRRLIAELGAEGYITVTGWLERATALEQVAGCLVLLYPTDAEGVPGGVLEAMSLGVPALASPAGGIPDVIDNGVDGVFLSGTDADTIASELSELLLSDRLPSMAEEAVKKIEARFSLRGASDNFRAIRGRHGKENRTTKGNRQSDE